jgi:hypothetical protein
MARESKTARVVREYLERVARDDFRGSMAASSARDYINRQLEANRSRRGKAGEQESEELLRKIQQAERSAWLRNKSQIIYRNRFAAALSRLCGVRPPDDLVAGWLAGDESHVETGADTLQDWASIHRPFHWATGIGTIDAARALADEPDPMADPDES